VIVFQNVTKSYGGRVALDDITLSVDRNEFIFLVGPNGAGKSTFLKMITLEERPSSGLIIVGGFDTDNVSESAIPAYRRRIGMVFQDTRLFPDRSVIENVSLPLRISGVSGGEMRRSCENCLRTVGLDGFSKRKASELSGGELRRVAIARAIVSQPEILLADEPTDSLSPSAADNIMNLLLGISLTGVTTVVATHDRDAVDRLRRRVVRIEQGKVASDEFSGGFNG
tara:strand:- start:2221 stop:2898 length:678 start_codon:yes stop_codon:yes gene_type:complete